MTRSSTYNTPRHSCGFRVMWEQSDGLVDFADTCLISPLIRMRKVCSYVDDNVFYYLENNFGQCYYCTEETQIASEAGHEDFTNKKFLQDYLTKSKKAIEKAQKLILTINKLDLSIISDLRLYQLVKSSGELIIELLTYFTACQPQCIYKLEYELKSYIEKTMGQKELTNILSKVTAPEKLSTLNLEELHWLQIVRRTIKKKKRGLSLEDISKHASIYSLLGATDGSDPWDFEHFLSLMKQDIKRDTKEVEKRIEEIERSTEKSVEAKKMLYQKYKFDKYYVYLASTISKLGHNRLSLRIDAWMPLYFLFKRKLETEIARRKNLTVGEVRSLTFSELLNFLRTGNIDRKELKNRLDCFLIGLESGNLKIYSGDKARKRKRELVQDVNFSEIKELKGAVAMEGKVIGEAIVFNWNDKNIKEKMFTMKEGQVLVAGQTRPMLIPAIRKAAAIITDEGGIISHAAIVSREFGIPCIIGANYATKVFTDGDIVEVDAIRGVARKIERRFTIGISSLTQEMSHTVGNKAAKLGQMFPFFDIPVGFCITEEAYQYFLEFNNLSGDLTSILSTIENNSDREIDTKSLKILRMFTKSKIPHDLKHEILLNYDELSSPAVAVRSSALSEDQDTASFAGQLDTYLNVNSYVQLINSIKKCWASLYSTRAIIYRNAKKIPQKDLSMGILVQKMIDSAYSGVIFTKAPIKNKENFSLIEIVRGLGDKLVGGEVSPNRYLIERGRNFRTVEKEEKFILNNVNLTKVIQIGLSIEKFFGKPMDIEFAIDKDNQIWILQARPITPTGI